MKQLNQRQGSGWLISLKRWHVPLYVRTEAPERHISWTGDKDQAQRFYNKATAVDFLERLGEKVEECDIKYCMGSR